MLRAQPVHAWLCCLPLLLGACRVVTGPEPIDGPVECTSLLGIPLAAPELAPERREELSDELRAAQARYAEAPHDEEAAIWLGRRLGYLGRYREAVAVYSEALEEHPGSARLLRHRGHRYLTLRRFAEAERDLARAATLLRGVPDTYEADGQPNAAGVPRSTLQSNVWYHLGLAQYLRGEYAAADASFERCRFFASVNDDMLAAATYWSVLTAWKRDDRPRAQALLARVPVSMQLYENQDYHRLLRFFADGQGGAELLADAQKGDLSSSTLGFGLGAWHLSHGAKLQAHRAFQLALGGPTWAAFGYIAAEVELSRAGEGSR
ncbi:MAG: hypothetical protein H6828_07000 [Planctomycetes bacterium]|nr:hypothetical protein [Planctomycetota bacterium]